MASAETQRLFFALWPDASTRDAIYKAGRRVIRVSGGKPVRADNYHATLAFLGSVDAGAAVAARDAAAGVHGPPFELRLDRFGFWAKPRVVWLGAGQVPEAARRLAAGLTAALIARGLTPDPKPFVPHVTLVRKVSKPGDFGSVEPVAWPVTSFALVRSVTHPEGSQYSVLASWPLTDGCEIKNSVE